MNEVNIKKLTVSLGSWWLVILGWLVEKSEGDRVLEVTWPEVHAGSAALSQVFETLRTILWSSNVIMDREVEKELEFQLSEICGN